MVSNDYRLAGVLSVSSQEMLVLFSSGYMRVAAEVYYPTPIHIYAFSPEYLEGAPVVRLSAADGYVKRWMINEKTLWLATLDNRDRINPRSYAMSLHLGELFTH